MKIELELYKTDGGYGIWLSDIGSSGIEVKAATKEKCAEELTPYIEDYLFELDEKESED